MKATTVFAEFFNSEKAGGFFLIFYTAVSLILANSIYSDTYLHFLDTEFFYKPLTFWINEGLMTFFFLLVGLEIERELYLGEFSRPRKATLPVMAAIGGMVVPALIYISFNHGTPYKDGFGIPMATDIAFSLGILSLLGKRVPIMLKVFLTALAIIDDLGAIVIIALFYSKTISWAYLCGSVLLFLFMLVLRRQKVYQLRIYFGMGILLWYCLYQTGIHPTITGVMLAFAIPFRQGGENSPSYRMQHLLHRPVAFVVLPLFALVNTAIVIQFEDFQEIFHPAHLGIILGLVVGKPVGILGFSLLGVAFGWCVIPGGIKKRYFVGIGLLAGIGFTMSIFITLLAYTDPEVISKAKFAVLLASIIAGVAGFVWLNHYLPREAAIEEEEEDNGVNSDLQV